MKIKNKRAQEEGNGTITFIILNVLFFGIMLIFLARVGTGVDSIEKVSVRKIALAIDSLRPRAEITLYMPEMFDLAKKNNVEDNMFFIDYKKGEIIVRLKSDGGASFYYFNDIKPGSFNWDINKKEVIIRNERTKKEQSILFFR